jgi:hypothetical protein
MTATAAPIDLTATWTSAGDTGYSYRIDVQDAPVRLAFASSTPGATVRGHAVENGALVTPPTGMAIYLRAEGGAARVTVTQGDAVSSGVLPAGNNNIGDVDVASIAAGSNLIGRVKPEGDEYETVAASQTAQTLGATGATGDYISGILVVPGTVNPGNVLLLDNATSITVFAGGTNSVASLHPFFIPLGITSVSGAWKITTGANVTCIGIGNFT